MADTLQGVLWTIERRCPFRDWEEWSVPDDRYDSIHFLRHVSRAESLGKVVNGILVTSCQNEPDGSGKTHPFPVRGLEYGKRIAPFDGLTGARTICQDCVANAPIGGMVDVAGCFGFFYLAPDSNELEQELWRIINARHLEQRLRTAFTLTTPLWYGFWISSPLQFEQVQLLIELLDGILELDHSEEPKLRHFVDALGASLRSQLPVHVSLEPPGHADFGYTTYPHCPRCKAEPELFERGESQKCRACGYQFIAQEHEPPEDDLEMELGDFDLRNQFDKPSFESFARTYLIQQGATPKQADEVIDIKDLGSYRRQVEQVLRRRKTTLARLRTESTSQSHHLSSTRSLPLAEDVDLDFVRLPAATQPTAGVWMTCTGMSTNGVRTSTTTAMTRLRQTGVPGSTTRHFHSALVVVVGARGRQPVARALLDARFVQTKDVRETNPPKAKMGIHLIQPRSE